METNSKNNKTIVSLGDAKSNFTIILNSVIKDNRLTGLTQKLLFSILSDSNEFKLSMTMYCNRLKITDEQFYSAIEDLEQLGYISIKEYTTPNGKKFNHYTISQFGNLERGREPKATAKERAKEKRINKIDMTKQTKETLQRIYAAADEPKPTPTELYDYVGQTGKKDEYNANWEQITTPIEETTPTTGEFELILAADELKIEKTIKILKPIEVVEDKQPKFEPIEHNTPIDKKNVMDCYYKNMNNNQLKFGSINYIVGDILATKMSYDLKTHLVEGMTNDTFNEFWERLNNLIIKVAA